MTRARTNLVVIMSDEHDPRYMGSSGHPFIRTPNLDRLAARAQLHQRLYAMPHLRAGTGRLRHRRLCPSDRLLGQRHRL
ncbi:hypothetical protein [Roseomonas sp. KE2513]|uniref:hypothetical protein n=1 Tax=Roseomonas sp. KE2513 TaxID=2479202 RepID=UPI001E4117DE|nr:hypothetical protein [Roseomonas sp. KE2513]